MANKIDTLFGTYDCRGYFNDDLDNGLEISKNGNLIGKMVSVNFPDEEEKEEFVDSLEIWLTENE